jgi:hypothetical protein
MTYLIIVYFMTMLSPLFPPLILVGVSAVQRLYNFTRQTNDSAVSDDPQSIRGASAVGGIEDRRDLAKRMAPATVPAS